MDRAQLSCRRVFCADLHLAELSDRFAAEDSGPPGPRRNYGSRRPANDSEPALATPRASRSSERLPTIRRIRFELRV